MKGVLATGLSTLALLPTVLGGQILQTNGFSTCGGDSSIKVNNVDISFDRSTSAVTFDVSGSSKESQDVVATLIISAYGKQIYSDTFDPCASDTHVAQLCPVPAGTFSATGTQAIPSSYANEIPGIAYSIPDLDGTAQMVLKAKNGGQELACIQSGFDNGKTVSLPAVSYVAVAIAAGALALSAVGALATGSSPGSSTPSPGFVDVMQWFQGIAINGMYSVNYPMVYRSFAKNFAFSTGLIPWAGMQNSIDNFRAHTGGNLTQDSYAYLQNTTLVFPDNSTSQTTTNIARRAVDALLLTRDVITSVNGTGSSNGGTSKESHLVSGIEGYVELLTIPQANTFTTVLLVFAIVVAAIIVGILLFKVILEAWALFGSFPKSLTTFRKEYWRVLYQTITSLVLLLYGVWTLYCIFQFTHGDSWAAKLLAGLTLGAFTALLGWYTVRIYMLAKKFKRASGDSSSLYEDKNVWKNYRLFYENYKRGRWWLFMPAIVYMFAKGCLLAAADGHGLVQTIGQLVIEGLMLGLLFWSRPYNRKSGNWINIVIQIVRVCSVVCILVFVEELGIAQTTKTITGVILIAVQSALTVILAILIAVNSIITCCKENPHRKTRKANEKRFSSMNDLSKATLPSDSMLDDSERGYQAGDIPMEPRPYHSSPYGYEGAATLPTHQKNRLSGSTLAATGANPRYSLHREASDSQQGLMSGAAKFAGFGGGATNKGVYQTVSRTDTDAGSRDISPPSFMERGRQPTYPLRDHGYRG